MEDGALRREAARLDVSSLLEGEAVAAVSDDDLSSVQALQQVLENRLAGAVDDVRNGEYHHTCFNRVLNFQLLIRNMVNIAYMTARNIKHANGLSPLT